MNQPAPAPAAKSLLEEYAAEVNKAPGDAGETNAADDLPGSAAALGRAAAEPEDRSANLEMIMRIPVTLKVVLGSATMPVANLTTLGRGAVIALDRRVGDPVDVMVNGRIVARGEVVVVDEATSRFGISLTEVVGPSSTEKGA